LDPAELFGIILIRVKQKLKKEENGGGAAWKNEEENYSNLQNNEGQRNGLQCFFVPYCY
jgi:hypothetical protein